MREYPIKPLDHAVWWAEHIIKHGGDHLQSPAANMHWIEYYEVKLLIIVLGILACILYLLVLITKKAINLALKFCRSLLKLKTT